MAADMQYWTALVLCGGIVVLGGCADNTVSAGRSATDSPSVGHVFTVPVSTISVAGSGSVGPARTTAAGDVPIEPAPSATSTWSRITSSTVHLTAADTGRMISVRVGTRMYLDLAPSGGSSDTPAVDLPTVLREAARFGGYPRRQSGDRPIQRHRPRHRAHHQPDRPRVHAHHASMPAPQREFVLTISV